MDWRCFFKPKTPVQTPQKTSTLFPISYTLIYSHVHYFLKHAYSQINENLYAYPLILVFIYFPIWDIKWLIILQVGHICVDLRNVTKIYLTSVNFVLSFDLCIFIYVFIPCRWNTNVGSSNERYQGCNGCIFWCWQFGMTKFIIFLAILSMLSLPCCSFFFSFFSIALSGKSVSHILYSLRRWDLQLFPAWLDMELVLVMAMDLVCHMYSYFSILSNNIKFHLFLTLGICYGMAPPADRYYIAWYADAFLLKSLHCFPFYFSIHVFLFGESFVLTVSRVFLPLSLYLLCY